MRMSVQMGVRISPSLPLGRDAVSVFLFIFGESKNWNVFEAYLYRISYDFSRPNRGRFLGGYQKKRSCSLASDE